MVWDSRCVTHGVRVAVGNSRYDSVGNARCDSWSGTHGVGLMECDSQWVTHSVTHGMNSVVKMWLQPEHFQNIVM